MKRHHEQRSTVSPDERDEIARLREDEGLSARAIGERVRRHHRTVCRVLAGIDTPYQARNPAAARTRVAVAARALAREQAAQLALRPPGVKAPAFSDRWWIENQINASQRAREALESASRITAPEHRAMAVGQSRSKKPRRAAQRVLQPQVGRPRRG